MKKITDEILNEYIDNMLDVNSINELKQNLENDPSALKNLQALKTVNESLRKMEVYNAPDGITEKIMKLVYSKATVIKKNVRNFMTFIYSVLGLIVTVCSVLGAVFISTQIDFNTSSSIQIKESISKGMEKVVSFLNNDLILTIGSSFILIALLGIYFVLESHKNFKNKLESFSN